MGTMIISGATLENFPPVKTTSRLIAVYRDRSKLSDWRKRSNLYSFQILSKTGKCVQMSIFNPNFNYVGPSNVPSVMRTDRQCHEADWRRFPLFRCTYAVIPRYVYLASAMNSSWVFLRDILIIFGYKVRDNDMVVPVGEFHSIL